MSNAVIRPNRPEDMIASLVDQGVGFLERCDQDLDEVEAKADDEGLECWWGQSRFDHDQRLYTKLFASSIRMCMSTASNFD